MSEKQIHISIIPRNIFSKTRNRAIILWRGELDAQFWRTPPLCEDGGLHFAGGVPAYKDKKRGTWYASFYYRDAFNVNPKKKAACCRHTVGDMKHLKHLEAVLDDASIAGRPYSLGDCKPICAYPWHYLQNTIWEVFQ